MKIMPREISIAQEEALKIVAKARFESESIIAEAKGKASEIKRLAYAEGHENGLANSVSETIAFFENLIGLETKHLNEMIDIIIAVCQKIIQHEISAKPELIRQMLEDRLSQVRHLRSLKLILNPVDFEAILAYRDQISSQLLYPEQLLFLTDDSIQQGGCKIVSPSGSIDARLDIQLQAIRSILVRHFTGQEGVS